MAGRAAHITRHPRTSDHVPDHARRRPPEWARPVDIYTSCATCGTLLNHVEGAEDRHPNCPPPTDPVRVLRRRFLAAVQECRDEEADRLAAELDAIDNAPPRLLDAALAYAAWGWPVFPCRPGLKAPASHKGLIEHGLKDATTDPERIRDWWWRWPHANIGLATGYLFDVIDIDPAGYRWLSLYGGIDGPLPDIHGQVVTPRGAHLFIQAMGQGNLAGLADGVDYRGRGGYVLAPPSVLTPAAYVGKDQPEHWAYAWRIYPSPTIKRRAVLA